MCPAHAVVIDPVSVNVPADCPKAKPAAAAITMT